MSADQLEDLKQFITTTVTTVVGESEQRLKTELRAEFHNEIDSLRTELREGFVAVAEAINSINDRLDKTDRKLDALWRWSYGLA